MKSKKFIKLGGQKFELSKGSCEGVLACPKTLDELLVEKKSPTKEKKLKFGLCPGGLPTVSFTYAEDGLMVYSRQVVLQVEQFDVSTNVIGYEYITVGCNADTVNGWVKKVFKCQWIFGGEIRLCGSWKADLKEKT